MTKTAVIKLGQKNTSVYNGKEIMNHKSAVVLEAAGEMTEFVQLLGKQKLLNIGDTQFSPQQLTALLLKNILNNQETERVIFVVPPQADTVIRQAIQEAARMAGINILAMINAAEAAYHQGDPIQSMTGITLIISYEDNYLNMTCIDKEGEKLEEIATDFQLINELWDNEIIEHNIKNYVEQFLNYIYDYAEIETIDQVIWLGKSVGVTKMFDDIPQYNVKEEDILKGALNYIEKMDLKRVCSKSYGLAVFTNEKKIFNMIYRNTELPSQVVKTFFTHYDGQTEINLQVYENDSDEQFESVNEENQVGFCTLNIMGKLPMGTEIQVKFELTGDGILHVEACEPKTNAEVKAELMIEELLNEEEFLLQKTEIEKLYNEQKG